MRLGRSLPGQGRQVSSCEDREQVMLRAIEADATLSPTAQICCLKADGCLRNHCGGLVAVNLLQLAWHAVQTHFQLDRVLRHLLKDRFISVLSS